MFNNTIKITKKPRYTPSPSIATKAMKKALQVERRKLRREPSKRFVLES